jgi:hypothetical protein
MVRLFMGSSSSSGAPFMHYSHVSTQSLTLTYTSGHQYCSTTFRNVTSLPRCPLRSRAASIDFSFRSVPTNTLAGGSLVFHLQSNIPSERRHFLGTGQNCSISFIVFPSGRFRFPSHSPTFFHLLLHTSTSLNPTNSSYALLLLLLSGPCSTFNPRQLAFIVSSGSSSSSGS